LLKGNLHISMVKRRTLLGLHSVTARL